MTNKLQRVGTMLGVGPEVIPGDAAGQPNSAERPEPTDEATTTLIDPASEAATTLFEHPIALVRRGVRSGCGELLATISQRAQAAARSTRNRLSAWDNPLAFAEAPAPPNARAMYAPGSAQSSGPSRWWARALGCVLLGAGLTLALQWLMHVAKG